MRTAALPGEPFRTAASNTVHPPRPGTWFGHLTILVGWLLVVTPALASAPAPTNAQSRYEIFFMENMIDHHAMAVNMGMICEQRAVHPELLSLCSNIVASQSSEIATMTSWLSAWYGVSYSPEMTQGQQQQMAKLASLSGADFEITFLKRMIRHHWKAVIRASGCIERAYHEELVSLCQDIVSAQTAEIEEMRSWLCAWYSTCNYGPKGADLRDD